MFAPDLINGYAINAFDSGNRWQTDLKSAMLYTINGQSKRAYLTNECRAEDIFTKRGTMIRGDKANYEFAVIIDNGSSYIYRSGPYLYGLNIIKNKKAISGSHAEIPTNRQAANFESKIFIEDVEVIPIDFAYFLDVLQGKKINNDNNYFMRIVWEFRNGCCELFTRCRYINFPPNYETGAYIQPQAGYTLYFDGTAFWVAYVATFVTADGTQSTEFCYRRPVPFLANIRRRSWLSGLAKRLGMRGLGRMILSDEFVTIDKVDAICTFYRYP